ncbi:permease [Streptomyces sp. WAC07061]|uniref:permease n=1 Tax=Streptomyces sp. WAC07061 TaxID=2487410 RepID=UPI0021AF1216|nr:permease [Streptomyces sp. WAC07061]
MSEGRSVVEGSVSTVTGPTPPRPSVPSAGGYGPERRRSPVAGAVGSALVGAVVVAVLAGPWLERRFGLPAFGAWRTLLIAVVIQGVPFLMLGTVVSAAIGTFVPARVFSRVLPRNPVLAVPVAGAAGVVLPGCECASVPVAGSLMRRGVAPAAALTFLLAAPAVNPVVLVATAIAFPGKPEMVAARFGASLVTAVVMGWLWIRWGREEWLRLPAARAEQVPGAGRLETFRRGLQHDFLQAGGFLVIGAMASATFNVLVPPSVLEAFSGSPWLGVLAAAALAVLLSVCSEADAFVAASFTGFSPTARLAFMVVGPMVDMKLIALQSGAFGRAFAVRFCAATFAVALLCCALVGGVLL